MSRFHDLEMDSLEGESVAFSSYAGSANLVVNVASA
jgi:glutathione peroxidase-family protein